MNRLCLFFCLLLTGCAALQHGPIPQSTTQVPKSRGFLQLPSADEVGREAAERKTFSRPQQAGRSYPVSQTGSDAVPCLEMSTTRPARTIGRAWSCVLPGDEIVIGPGEWNEALKIVEAGKPGLSKLIVVSSGASWYGIKGLPALDIRASYVQVYGFVGGRIAVGAVKGWTQGNSIKNSVTSEYIEIRGVGQSAEDPGLAATVLEGVATKDLRIGPNAYDVQMRGVTAQTLTIAGGRHTMKFSMINGDTKWNAHHTDTVQSEFKGSLVIGAKADNSYFGPGTETWGEITLGEPGKDKLIGLRLYEVKRHSPILREINVQSLIKKEPDETSR